MSKTRRLTVAQALVTFLANQWTQRDSHQQRLFAGCFGIFGHGNVAGLGQALLEAGDSLRYHQCRNEQAMVHTAAAYARMTDRMSTFACTTSVGPGATNLVTGAALATINRLPVLLLPGDTFATRPANPVLQELEAGWSMDVSVNDTLRPVSRYWDRVNRPEQLLPAALAAVRTLTDPAETGAVTLALPQDVQAEAFDWPADFLAPRVWHVRRPVPEPALLAQAAELIRASRRPLIVAGGGVVYSGAAGALRRLVEATGIPAAQTQAGKGALPHGLAGNVGAIGVTGTTAANALARDTDLVIGVGSRYTDFTTASRTAFARPDVQFVNINIVPTDAGKHAALPIVADAREALDRLRDALGNWQAPGDYQDEVRRRADEWHSVVARSFRIADPDGVLNQHQVIGVLDETLRPCDVVVAAAGSIPGDLHRLWRTADPKQYHVEYGYSCMGYEIAGGLGVKMAAPEREVYVLVGDGSYLMMAQELVTAVQEGLRLIVIAIQNHGFASIGSLSDSVGAGRLGTDYRYRDPATGGLDGSTLPVDLAANAASLGAAAVRVTSARQLRRALAEARSSQRPTVVEVAVEAPPAPGPGGWWDVPVAEVARLEPTRRARDVYEAAKRAQRHYVRQTITKENPDAQD